MIKGNRLQMDMPHIIGTFTTVTSKDMERGLCSNSQTTLFDKLPRVSVK